MFIDTSLGVVTPFTGLNLTWLRLLYHPSLIIAVGIYNGPIPYHFWIFGKVLLLGIPPESKDSKFRRSSNPLKIELDILPESSSTASTLICNLSGDIGRIDKGWNLVYASVILLIYIRGTIVK